MSICARHAALGMLLVVAGCSHDEAVNVVVGELASDRIELAAEAAEPVVELLVAEGERVTEGQPLLRQDAARATARLAEAEAALAQAEARRDELIRGPRSERIEAARATVAGAADELAFREAEFERIRKLAAQNLASPDQLDQARAAQDAARSALRRRQAELEELLTGTTVEELAQAESAVAQAAARRELARVDLERLEIRAPVAGVVDSRLFEVGERPAPGQPVLVLLGGAQPHARVYVPEAIRVQIRPGTRAAVRIDGLDEPLAGRVRWISSEAAFTPYFALTERDRGRLTYAAKVDLDAARERLPDGVPVEVELAIGDAQ
ncbi:MAG: HlyD family efflux transporter periplasmic adaptor subunit [Woeseiaceae bacterium]|nr:HlyD family efflux transporter periplasmic adaptor subunit [Woeseiaceae bacterium]